MRVNFALFMLVFSALILINLSEKNNSLVAAGTSIAVGGNGVINTVFGNGVSLPFSSSDFGKPAIEVPSSNVLQSGLTIGPDGTLYLSMPGRIVKVGSDGIVRPVVGICTTEHPRWPDCTANSTGDGGPAIEATVSAAVQGLSLGPDGSLYIADDYRVRRIGPDGIITTIAGSDQSGFSGDGGPALNATFGNGVYSISDVDVAQDGTIYVTDTGNHRIRKIDSNGIVTTIAGKGGNPPNCWEIPTVGPATDIFLFFPQTLTIGPDNALYVSNSYCATVRRIAGQTSTLLVDGFDGDGDGIAGSANQGNGVTFGLDNTLYLTYYYANGGNVLLARAPNDSATVLTTNHIIAGNVAVNGWRFSGDGGPAKNAEFAAPSTLATGPDGSIYVLDALNNRVRRISPYYSSTISPSNGGTLNTTNNDIAIQFPGGAVNASTDISLTVPGRASRPIGNYRPTRFFFSLNASSGGSTVGQFNKPYTLTVAYKDADLSSAGITQESRLNLFVWDGAKWQALLPCAGCSVDTVNNRVTLVLNHFSDFALMATPPSDEVYLPLIRR